MSKQLKITILTLVMLAAGGIFWGPQLQQYFGVKQTGEEVTQNILAVLQEREKEDKLVFIDFYGAF